MPPKPRPKARPVARHATSNSSATSNGESAESREAAAAAAKSAREKELDQDDAFFLRNTNLDWKKIDRHEREVSAAPPASSDPEDSDGSPPARKRHKTGKHKGKDVLPEWTKSGIIELDSSSDEDRGKARGNKAKKNGRSGSPEEQSNKRPRSRSRSLTPPPQLSTAQIQNARLAVRRALAETPRAPSPTDDWEGEQSQDTIVLDPELAAIQERVRSSQFLQGERSHGQGGGPETVMLKVNWKPHPQDPEGQEETVQYKYRRRDNFSVLFNEIADSYEVPPANLVVTFEGLRVFSSSTPDSLKIWAEAEMDACDKVTFEYLRNNRNQRPPTSSSGQPSGSQPKSGPSGGGDSDSETEVESSAEDDDTFKLTIRSGTVKDVTLTVRPSTTCGAIVKAFLKRAGLADKYSEGKSRRKSTAGGPRLVVDGDRMEPGTPISAADLEDGDQVEIAGL
ncbi:hypothetical protein PENSPDRAFT_651752 [Peniophora sp. CONT]|nr:hypothetical protein PENSPDRAFT_651752 [Peniophora sp. CONT]